jgi:hypothetical protein
MTCAKRIALPAALILLFVYILSGCLPIPATRQFQPNDAWRPEHWVGKGKHDRVRIGYTKIDDAFLFLSQQVHGFGKNTSLLMQASPNISPDWPLGFWSVSEDHRRFSLTYSVRTATWVWPLCFTAYSDFEQRWLTLDVDERGIVVNATTTDHPTIQRRLDDEEWHRVFPADTWKRFIDAGLFPSDERYRSRMHRRDATTQP